MCIELSICIAAVSFPLGLCTTCTLATTTTLGVAAAGTFTAVTGVIAALLAGILGIAAAAVVVVLAILCAPVIGKCICNYYTGMMLYNNNERPKTKTSSHTTFLSFPLFSLSTRLNISYKKPFSVYVDYQLPQ